ncbi:MAG TPA: TonB-dependent hemoglobin/transferrin/lactoferrin family receptor [Bauldia sp.]|nr:TonB-dependent hemoglobin/transferrin/lactoferrin family receptor [Bauldia sp.]
MLPAGALAQSTINLDVLTITAGKTTQAAIDALAGVSYLSRADLQKMQGKLPSDVLAALPGIVASTLGNDKGALVNIRGLQNFGRIAVTIDGARQDFSRNSHAGNGTFYLEPELLKSVTVVRGPSGNSYGSGAIGGVVAFETIDADDVLRDGEKWALSNNTGYESNGNGWFTALQAATRFNDAFDLVGAAVYRKSGDYANASGETVPFTGQEPVSGLVKATFRPAEGHAIELSGMQYYNQYMASRSAGLATAPPSFILASLDDTDTSNTAVTGKWSYSKPGDNVFDFVGTAYWNRTVTDQVKIGGPSPSSSSGKIGDKRHFQVDTTGVDFHNSSRFDGGGFDHKLTYGVDYFRDVADSSSDLTTAVPPRSTASTTSSGVRGAGGGIFEWEATRGWFDVLGSLRYDQFDLSGLDGSGNPVALSGSRISPKATVGITPKEGFTFYGTYAEGYRAPSITETFIGGTHQDDFQWIPNPNLKPETARTFEAGLNVKLDGLVTPEDAFRAKVTLFHTMVDNYIDIVSGVCPSTCPPALTVSQYQNVGQGLVDGVEVEGTYDAGWSYVNVAGSYTNARKASDGSRLNITTPAAKVSSTLGFRNNARTWDYGVTWIGIGKAIDVNSTTVPAYNLFNAFATWTVSDNVSLAFNVDNVFNTAYTDPVSGYIIDPSLGSPISSNGAGRTFKVSLKSRIGG